MVGYLELHRNKGKKQNFQCLAGVTRWTANKTIKTLTGSSSNQTGTDCDLSIFTTRLLTWVDLWRSKIQYGHSLSDLHLMHRRHTKGFVIVKLALYYCCTKQQFCICRLNSFYQAPRTAWNWDLTQLELSWLYCTCIIYV